MRPAPEPALTLFHALALGTLHGPAELLPVSSSAHTTLVPWLLGWPYSRLDPELRKAFEVALHAGTAAALIVGLRDEVAEAARGLDRRRLTLIVGSFVPPAVVGLMLERAIERRLGTPPTIAVGLTAARARGFRRPDANALSRHVALPVIVGATALKGVRLARRGLPGGVAGAFAAGVGAAFASTLGSVRLIRAVERDRTLAPYAIYRIALAAVVLRRSLR
jgi:undecaprenyl-diphosphatase